MKIVKQCPVCDGTNIEIVDVICEIKVPFADSVRQKQRVCKCLDYEKCGAPIRIWSEPASVIKKRIFSSAKRSIPQLLKVINDNGYSDDRIERALYLEYGTIAYWKKKKNITPEVIALVRFLYMNPTLIYYAEEGFNDERVRNEVKIRRS